MECHICYDALAQYVVDTEILKANCMSHKLAAYSNSADSQTRYRGTPGDMDGIKEWSVIKKTDGDSDCFSIEYYMLPPFDIELTMPTYRINNDETVNQS